MLVAFVVFPLALAGPWRERFLRAGAFVAGGAPSARRVGDPERRPLRRLRAGARRQRHHPVLPRVHHGQDRHARQRAGVTPTRGGGARHLVTRDPYKAYGVTIAEVFDSGSFRIHEDFYLLSDQFFGWDTNYSILRKAGIEAVKKHPGTYASGVLDTIWQQLSKSYFRTPPTKRRREGRADGRGGEGQRAPRADRGRADSRRTERLDLAPGQLHPGGVDVGDGASLHVLPSRLQTPLRRASTTSSTGSSPTSPRARVTPSSHCA